MKTENILWLTDFSEDSEHALPHAHMLAEQFHAKLYLMHVIVNANDHIYGRVEGTSWAREQHAQEQSETFMGWCKLRMLQDFSHHEVIIRHGEILEEILRVVEQKQIGTIVMATHGRSGLSHMLLGSVTEKVIRSVRCPVYVVRHPDRFVA